MGSTITQQFTAAPRYLDTRAAAAYLGLSASFLNKARVQGGGPRFSSLGRAVRYRIDDLDEWAARRSRTSTSVEV